jgi:RES domain-containing protein
VTGRRANPILMTYRIGDPDGIHPIYDSEGARLYSGRWNMLASPIIYTLKHYSTAMLEKLVHASSVLPPNQHHIRITIPNGTNYDIFQTAAHPGWDRKEDERDIIGSTGRAQYPNQSGSSRCCRNLP